MFRSFACFGIWSASLRKLPLMYATVNDNQSDLQCFYPNFILMQRSRSRCPLLIDGINGDYNDASGSGVHEKRVKDTGTTSVTQIERQ
jgi:hypothetical protein